MAIIHDMEEYVGSFRPVGQIADLVDQQYMRAGIGRERLLEVPSLTGIGEILDEFRRGSEQSVSKPFWMARYPMATAR